MTLIFGEKFLHGIFLLADSRISWKDMSSGKIICTEDNYQKIFRLHQNLFIAFAGSVNYACQIITFLSQEIKKSPQLGIPSVFRQKGSKLIRHFFNKSVKKEFDEKILLIIAGVDFSSPLPFLREGRIINTNTGIYRTEMFSISSPNFVEKDTEPLKPFVSLGSGRPAALAHEKEFINFAKSYRLDNPLAFQAIVSRQILRKKINEIDDPYISQTVGGPFQVITIQDGRAELYLDESMLTGKKAALHSPCSIVNKMKTRANLVAIG